MKTLIVLILPFLFLFCSCTQTPVRNKHIAKVQKHKRPGCYRVVRNGISYKR